MAEGGGTDNGKNTMPIRGKVKQVRESWAVHEDGAFAYQLQNEEINRHYGMNRFNRRTVREDIPIAKIVQTDEEIKQQNERFEQLQALRAQAEEDERVAKQIMEQEQLQTQAHKMAIELTDEEFAKAVQEKEKQKYERHLEKKKLQKLKKEREKIEKIQAQRTEEARLNVRSDNTEDLNSQMTDLNLQNGGSAMRYTRVTPGGRIEDDGDFSDFYTLPEHVDPAQRQALQEMQDEELAKLLQEQEHKRTKAEVDRNKLREIEEQDKRLAQIIEEQEKIRLKKAKQKWKQQQELKRSQEAAQRPPALPPRNQEHDHRRYRRNSFIQSMENGPEQNDGDDLSPHSLASSEEYLTPVQAADQRNQASQGPRSNSNRQTSSDNLLNNSVKQTHEIKQNNQNVQRIRNNTQGPNRVPPSQVPSHEMPDVERWLASHPPDASRGRLPSEDYIPDSPSPPGSYHSEDAFPYRGMSHSPPHNTSTDTGSHYAVSDPFNFNIAAAIDPTYTRRNDTSTERKQVINHGGRSMPQDGHTINTVSSRGDSFHEDGPGVVSPFVPVQGQRRTMGDKQKKSSRNQSGQMSDKQKNNCKQQ